MGSFLDKFLDVEKTSKATIANPRKVFEDILRQASGSAYTRDIKYNIYYQVFAFYGVVDGVGCSTLVANTALALAETGLTICVIDTSIMAPVQDVLLETNEAVIDENETKLEHLDWFDMPFTKKSPLHVSKKSKNISVLSFKGKRRGVIDFLSTNDSESLVEIALTTLHNKFDLILIDCCHELSSVNTACLQQAQQVIQVWNDSPTVVSNLENFITNSITMSCPLDKMRFVVANKTSKDAIGNLNALCSQYRCKLLTTNYLSEELYLLAVTGKVLFRVESTDEAVIDYTTSIIEIVCHILNIDLTGEAPKGTVTSEDILSGTVEGTYHKELKDFNDKFAEAHPEIQINTNPMNSTNPEVSVVVEEDEAVQKDSNSNEDSKIDSVMDEDKKDLTKKFDSLNYGGVMEEDDVKPEELVDSDNSGIPDILKKPEKKQKKWMFGKSKESNKRKN